MVASEAPPVRSGVARAVGRLAEGAVQAGHEVVVRSSADARATIAGDQVRVSTLGVSLRRSFIDAFDIVHLHGPAPSISDVLLARHRLGRSRRPLVYTHHFTVWGDAAWLGPTYAAYDRLSRRLAKYAQAVVVTTPSYRDHVEAVTGVGTVQVIPWGIDPAPVAVERRIGLEPGPLRVLVVGQMRRYKGHMVAARACLGVPELQLTLAGDGETRGELARVAAGAANISVVPGPDDETLQRLYADHDVILLPSTNVCEAFGIVLLEGMRYGCVPVASRLRGVVDVVGAAGRTFATGDPSSLRDTLLELDRDRVLLAGLSRASSDAARRYDWADTVDRYLDLYRRVAGGGRE